MRIQLYFLILFCNFQVNQCVYHSLFRLSDVGFQFQPLNYPGQILSTSMIENNLLKTCSILCTENILCRIYDINAVLSNQCRLFQGDINIHGNLISSSLNYSRVGFIQYSTSLYFNYGQACSPNSPEDRYLICGTNFTWICPRNTYWNSSISMCSAQSPVLGSTCQQNMSMCREDLNYTCLQFNQCGPLSILNGSTVLDNRTIIANSATVGLSGPSSILVNKTMDNSIIVVDAFSKQVIRFYDRISSVDNVTLIAKNWTGGNIFVEPYVAFINRNEKSNIYVSDAYGFCVYKIFNMQVISPVPTVVAGTKGAPGATPNRLTGPVGIAVDKDGYLYVSDSENHRIMRYAPNATSGIMIAGTGTAGNDSISLNKPYGMQLDENNSYIYVADSLNNRIQRFSLSASSPNNGTTVAGGYGNGKSNNQLNLPHGISLTQNKRTLYIADTENNRVQRWNIGEQSGVTIAGDPNGNPGNIASMLNSPYAVALDEEEETFLYVADTDNKRVIRFELI